MVNKNILVIAVLVALSQTAVAQDTADSSQANAVHAGGADAKTLDAVQVTGQFVEASTKSAMKQEVSVMDTPYSTSSYGGAFMKAIETSSIADLYSYMTGVRRGGSTGYDVSIRGFKNTQADKGAILVDGMPGLAGRFGSPPTIAAESIEVVKGPASALYGQAQPGGFINVITKKPKFDQQTVLDLKYNAFSGAGISLGDADGFSLGIDSTGHLDPEGVVNYRFIAEKSDKDGFRYGSYDEGHYISPSLAINLSEKTQATVAMEFRKRKNAYENNQLVAPNKDARLIADIRTRYQEADDFAEETSRTVSASVTHWFEGGQTFNFAWRNVDGEDYAQGFDNVAIIANGTVLQRRARKQLNGRTYNYFDTNLALPFKTGAIEHQAMVGVSGGVDTTDFERIQFFNGPASGPLSLPGPGRMNVSVYNPILGVSPSLDSYAAGPVNRRYTRSSSQGIYVSDLMTLSEHWKASFGVRYTQEKQITEERKTPPLTRSNKTISDVLPTLGLMYQPSEDWTLYASYATSFVPQGASVQNAAGLNEFDPQSAKQFEVGSKIKMLDGRLGASFSLFEIVKENTLAPIACNAGVGGTCSQQVGGEKSTGAEIEVDYSIAENWQVLFGYARTDAVIDKTYAANAAPLAGAQLTNSALNSANFWTRYDFTDGALKGLGLGLGAYYSSSIAGSLPSIADRRVLTLPSYTIADLALYYSINDRYDLTLKVGNLFDKRYYEGVNSTTNEIGVVPGLPRNVTLSLRIPFN